MTCPHCSGVLGILEESVKAGLRFIPAERKAMMARAEKCIAENTAILAARGYTQDAQGRWGFHNKIH